MIDKNIVAVELSRFSQCVMTLLRAVTNPYRGPGDFHPLVCADRSTSIRFRFFALRLAKSGLYSPNTRIDDRTQKMVEDHMAGAKAKYAKVEEWDSGFSDG